MRHKDTFTRTLRFELVVLLTFVMGILFGIILLQYFGQKTEKDNKLPLNTTITSTLPSRYEVIRDWRPL